MDRGARPVFPVQASEGIRSCRLKPLGGKKMGIKLRCPNGHRLHVKSFLAGKRGICPHCGEKFKIHSGKQHSPQGHDTVSPANEPPTAGEISSPPAHVAGTVSTDDPGAASSRSSSAPTDDLPGPSVSSESSSFESSNSADSAGRVDPIAAAPNAAWYVRPATGGQFGPAASDVMQTWLAEGRVGADSLVWCEGWDRWKQAGQVFPTLVPPNNLAWEVPELAAGIEVGMPDQLSDPRHVALSPGRSQRPSRRQSNLNLSLFIAITLVMAIVGLLPVLIYVAWR